MSERTQAQGGRRPKKVLHVFSGATGGAALSALGVITELRNEGIDACVVCHDMGGDLREQILDATRGEALFTQLYWWNKKTRAPTWRRPFIELKQSLRTGRSRLSAAKVASFAVRTGAELIHTCTVMTPEGATAARWLHLPHVWHVRELIGPGKPFRLPVEGPPLGAWLSKCASKVVANSEATAECVRGWLPAGLLEVVPNGVDLKRFRPREAPASRALPIVAMVGSLASRSKRHDLFIEAAKAVSRPADFRIYGELPDDAYAKELRASADGQVRFMGPFTDPPALMSELDVLVQPSDVESFGRVVVEAMAAGLPVVGVNGGGAKEIVVDGVTGRLAPPGDARALADLIAGLLDAPALRQRLGAAGRRRAEERFSMTACAASVERVYREAMTRPL